MTSLREVENQARLARITCGWKKPELPLEWVRRYWRDVHSPAITRRAGIYDYRHYQYDAVDPAVLGGVTGIETQCPADQQLMWNSDVRYRDEAALAAFDATPPGEAKAHLLGDIELIVDKSTTYRALGSNAQTYVDFTDDATPQGPPSLPSYALFMRQRADEPSFRESVRSLALNWAKMEGVLRVRMSLFEVPDMEAERKAGYPIKTHPVEQQYQAIIELVLIRPELGPRLLADSPGADCAGQISAIHAYPIAAIYTSVYAAKPTLVGLRGYAAHQAIQALGAKNQKQESLIRWIYGAVPGNGKTGADH